MEDPCDKVAACLFKDLSQEDARAMLNQIADEGGKRGAKAVLRELGLIPPDEDGMEVATKNVGELMELLTNWRAITKTTKDTFHEFFQSLWKGVAKIGAFLLLAYIASRYADIKPDDLKKLVP